MSLKTRTLEDFLDHPFDPPEYIYMPVIPKRSAMLLAGQTGGRKSFVSLALAVGAAAGVPVLGYMGDSGPVRTLFVDGEMDPTDVQERLRAILKANLADGYPPPEPGMLHILARADQDEDEREGIPSLAAFCGKGQQWVNKAICETGSHFIILDNLSTLAGCDIDPNNEMSFSGMKQWLVVLKSAGFTVLLIHHTGKPTGPDDGPKVVKQRGTEGKLDIMSGSILLSRRDKNDGSRWEWDKPPRRGVQPDPFTFRVEFEDDGECRLAADYSARQHEKILHYATPPAEQSG